MNKQRSNKCPQCAEGTLRPWDELTEAEREVVRRLPGATGNSQPEREALHRWCSRCWYEARSVPLDT